ncbi:DNRLRE domain-containing protein [Streptomyces sp. LP11]|uniref:DNRLRE domain-containing protein n=1 Tax=Streptomyces pyxinicus TaxID=2970331 RepID=A0ABT2B9P1_9ACTN|nr:DNRLRE domain-containing protein [Streptomyces sp. LP11]MCS0605233.1 DNRLRE domain-containing protein [Streptomyces sp. LP11]
MTAGAVLVSTPSVAVAVEKSNIADKEADSVATELERTLAALDAHPIKEAETVEAALEAAKIQERRVEVMQMRTETETVYANPDGTLTTDVAAGPVRMVRDGKWVDVDLDLKRAAGGDVEAVAHPEHLKLAGEEGTLPKSLTAVAEAAPSQAKDLVSIGQGRGKIALQWKGGLPAPELEGNRATYKGAVPEGDLVVEATRTGFEQFLRLNEAPEDGAPMVVPMTVPEGTAVKQNPDGSITFSDSSGEKTAVMPAPTMWDSRRDPRSFERTNSRRVDMRMSQNGNTVTLTLTPDADWLNDPKTRYPVTIDPAADALDVLFDTFVQGGDTTDQSANTDLKLGWPGDYEGSTKRVARSFVTFRTSPFADALVSEAKLKLWNYHSWSAEARGWEVWAADPADKNTRWTKQPAMKEKIATSTETKPATSPGWVSADVTKLAQTWSSAKAETGSVALKAADEGDTYGWKRFYSANTAEQDKIPTLEVTYNYRPGAGSNLQAGTPFISSGGIFKVNSTTPTLRASITDSNAEDSVRGTFEITDDATGKVVATVNSEEVPSNTTASVKIPAGKLTSGRTYSFRTTSFDGTHYATGWSPSVKFHVDTSWQPTAAENTLGLANLYSEAADITAATSSDDTYASIAATEENTVSVPWDGRNQPVDIKNEQMPTKLTIPGATAKGTQVGGNVVYTSNGAVDTVVQPTVDGGSRTLNIIKNGSAPHDYETGYTIPAGMKAVVHDEDGSVSLYSEGDDDTSKTPTKEPAGFFEAPWAKDADGNDVPTSYKVVGNKLVQHVEFDNNSAFPIVIDPSWWSTTKKIFNCAVRGVAPIVLAFTPSGSTYRVITAVRLAKKIGFKKVAKLIYNYSKRRKMKLSLRKMVGTFIGLDGIKKHCKF